MTDELGEASGAPPQPDERRLIIADHDPGIGTTNEVTAARPVPLPC